MPTITEKQLSLIEEFNKFSGWEEKYKHLMELGKRMPPLPNEFKIDKYRVKGCQSQVWLKAGLDGDRIVYKAESDAMIVNGLASMLVTVYSGETPAAIMKDPADFLKEIGLTSHLSQSRANGLAAMVRQFKNYAIAFEALMKQRVKS